MKSKRNLIQIYLVGAVLFAFAAAVQAQNYYDYTTNGDGTITITGYIGPSGVVSIPSTIYDPAVTNYLMVTGIGNSAFMYNSSLTSVTIPNSVTSIGDDAFELCTSLSSVMIPNSVISIGSTAFAGTGLRTVTIPNSVTSIGDIAFSDCTSLTSVALPNNITSIGNSVFAFCSSLTSVTIPSSVTSIGEQAFSYCTSLSSVTIPNSVTKVGDSAFSYCSGLTSVTVGSSVTSIGDQAFDSCPNLNGVTLPNSVTNIGGGAFQYCTSLSSITIPNSVTSIGDYAFFYCSSLTSVTIPSSVNNIGEDPFGFCTSLIAITVDALNSVYCSVDGVLFNKSQTALIQCPGAKAGSYAVPNSAMGIADSAFSGCTSLNSVIIPNSVTSIGDDAFDYCTSLSSVMIPSSITSIEQGAFIWCTSLSSVTIPDSVTSIGTNAFALCRSLASVTVPDSVTSIEYEAFSYCTSLTNVCFEGNEPSDGGTIFAGDGDLSVVYYINGTKGWGTTFSGVPTKTCTQCDGTLVVVDANPLFLSGTLLPQPTTSTLLTTLQNASTTRNVAAADGITKLLLMVATPSPGNVVFSQSGGISGTFSNVDGSAIPASGVPTVTVGGQQMGFALYTVPDQTSPGGSNVNLLASFQAQGASTSVQLTPWPLQLVQTPVVLVHGLWGNATTWEAMRLALNNANINSTKAIYTQLSAAGPFSTYSGVVINQIQQMLTTQRAAGIAVTRADVVAHSMGGILTRMDASNPDNVRPENFNNGYIRRVITVDTPHWGATPAQFLLDLAQDSQIFNIETEKLGNPILNGAVQDLSPYTFAALSGGTASAARQSLQLPSVAISCYVLQDADFDILLSALYGVAKVKEISLLALQPSYQSFYQNLLCSQMLSLGDDNMAISGKLFFGNSNDGVVGLSSQNGGSASFSDFADTDHLQAPDSSVIQNAIIQLLEGPVSSFATAGFPAVSPADLNSQICNSAPSPTVKGSNPLGKSPSPMLQLSLITLTTPTNGSTAKPGTQVTIQAQPVTNASVQEVDFVVTSGNNQAVAWDIITAAPFSDTITVPTNLLGPLTITAVGQDAQGDYDIEQSTIEIVPGSGLTLQSISVYPTNLTFSELMTTQTLELTGAYSDGVARDITLGGAGTAYSTSTPSVAVVDQNGNVSAVGNGSAQITVTNAGKTVQIPVQVSLQPPQILSILPNSLQPGTSNVTIIITGLNLGGTTNIMFLRNGKPEPMLTAGSLIFGANVANIQAQVSVASNTTPGLLNMVITTPVGSSAQTPVQGNRIFIGQPLVINNLGFTSRVGGGGFGFTIVGSTGSSCIIQTSTNLLNWVNEVTNTLTFGSYNFTETNAPASVSFYRIELLP